MKTIKTNWIAIVLGFIVVITVALIFLSGMTRVKATDQQKCLCHNVLHNPVNVCSDDDSYKEGHQSHLDSGFDTDGACPVPTPTATPSTTPTATPSTTPTATMTPSVTPTATATPSVKPTPVEECEEGCDPTPTPTRVVTPTSTPAPVCTQNCGNPPTFAGSSTNPPVCNDGNTVKLPENVHVVRSGESATVNFFLTEGDSANIYYKEVHEGSWSHAVIHEDIHPNEEKFVSYTIHGLNPLDGYTFGIQQVKGCGGGETVTAVIVDGPESETFTLSYWEWTK